MEETPLGAGEGSGSDWSAFGDQKSSAAFKDAALARRNLEKEMELEDAQRLARAAREQASWAQSQAITNPAMESFAQQLKTKADGLEEKLADLKNPQREKSFPENTLTEDQNLEDASTEDAGFTERDLRAADLGGDRSKGGSANKGPSSVQERRGKDGSEKDSEKKGGLGTSAANSFFSKDPKKLMGKENEKTGKDRLKEQALRQGLNTVAPGAGEVLDKAKKVNDTLNKSAIGRAGLGAAEKFAKVASPGSAVAAKKLGLGVKEGNKNNKNANKKDQKQEPTGSKKRVQAKKNHKILYGVAGFLVFVMLAGVLFSGGTEFSDQYALASKEGTEIPEPMIKIYKDAGQNNDVPWTVLAALGKVQTNHGAKSPYDLNDYGVEINRDPERVGVDQGGQVPGIVPVSATGSPEAQQLIAFGKTYLGTPYVWGGDNLEAGGFDCSGLMQYIFNHFGMNVGRTSRDQQKGGVDVPLNALQPGDLVFYGNPSHHVAMYVGNGQMLESPHTGDVVKITTLRPPTNARRYLSASSNPQDGVAKPAALRVDPNAPYVTPTFQRAAEIFDVPNLPKESFTKLALQEKKDQKSEEFPVKSYKPGIAPGVYADESCYDDNKGAEVQVFPCTVPAIGTKDQEGKGILLLLSSAEGFSDIDPQNVKDSVDLTAKILRGVRKQLEKEEKIGDASNLTPEEADKFWATAVSRLPIADPSGALTQCGLPSGANGQAPLVQESIQAIWRCEIGKAKTIDFAASAGKNADGSVSFSTQSNGAASENLIKEALAVAWGYSKWGKNTCQNGSAGGVFPLTKEQLAAGGGTDMCNAEENIRAAAKVVLAGEAFPVATRSSVAGKPYAPMFGGWANIQGALGNAQVRDNFGAVGPHAPWEPGEACLMQAEMYADLLTKSPTNAFATADPAKIGTDAATNQALNQALLGVPDSANNPVCAGGMPTEQLSMKLNAVNNLAQSFQETEIPKEADPITTPNGAPSSAPTDFPVKSQEEVELQKKSLEALRIFLQAKVDNAPQQEAVWGTDSAIARLSTTGYGITYSAPGPSLYQNVQGLDTAQVISYAIYYGGIVPDDPRAGTPPFTSASSSLLGGQALNIVTQRQNLNSFSVHPAPPPSAETKNFSGCGSPANAVHYGRPDLVDKFEKMCADAETSGVKITISSSTRSAADQQRLRNQYGTSRAAAGVSPHERGVAADLGDGGGNAKEWMNAVVGCFNEASKTYTPYATPIGRNAYADALDANRPSVDQQALCAGGDLPIKRVQTYGLILAVCGPPTDFYKSAGIRCAGRWPSGFMREDWHVEPGVPILVAGAPGGAGGAVGNFNPAQCGNVTADINNPQSLAAATYAIFRCAGKQQGWENRPATPFANGNGPNVFRNFSEQFASEAVIIGYCESGFAKSAATSNNPWGYGGVFQFGDGQADTFIPGGRAAKFDPIANISGAAKYSMSEADRSKWGGWGPWAVVNTDYGGPNVGVKVPVLPRFASTRGGYVGQRSPGPLPNWALDPSSGMPRGGCGNAFKGLPWP